MTNEYIINAVKSFLKMLVLIAETNRDDLKGKMTEKEYSTLGDIRAGVQNDLGGQLCFIGKIQFKI